jgi:hypothetical protein
MIEFEQEQTDREQPCKAPMYCNKYAMDDVEERAPKQRPNMRSQSMPRQSRYGDRLMPPQLNGREPRGSASGNSGYEENMDDMPPRKGRKQSVNKSRPGKFSVASCAFLPNFFSRKLIFNFDRHQKNTTYTIAYTMTTRKVSPFVLSYIQKALSHFLSIEHDKNKKM